MRFAQRRRSPEMLFIVALFCVFALSAMGLALMGAGVYKGTAAQMDATFDQGAAMAYLRTKLRQNDAAGAISVGELEGTPAIVMRSEYLGQSYFTYLYYHDGALRELFTMPGSGAGLTAGDTVVELSGFAIESVADSLLRLTATDARGVVSEVYVYLRGGGS